MACESMNYYAKKTRKNDVVSVDGAWDHRREGSECQAVFINQRFDKVVYVSFITKSHGKVIGNFNGAFSNMEHKEKSKTAEKQILMVMYMTKINL